MIHREFKEVLNDLDSDYGDVIYFTSVRWLSRDVLKRVWQLRDEISNFLDSKGQKKTEFEDPTWISDFAFLVDMTTHQYSEIYTPGKENQIWNKAEGF